MADPVALGFRVKTGKAVAVALAGPVESPRVIARRPITLYDPRVPSSFQPYHAALDEPEAKALAIVRRLSGLVFEASRKAVRDVVEEVRRAGYEARAAGIVTGSQVDPETIRNPHMHAHAAEGRLFHDAVAAGVEACGLPHLTLVARAAYELTAKALGRTPEALDRAVAELGRPVGRPWRAEEKTAALGAWLALRRPRGRRPITPRRAPRLRR